MALTVARRGGTTVCCGASDKPKRHAECDRGVLRCGRESDQPEGAGKQATVPIEPRKVTAPACAITGQAGNGTASSSRTRSSPNGRRPGIHPGAGTADGGSA